MDKRFARLCEDPLNRNFCLDNLLIDEDACKSGCVSFVLSRAKAIGEVCFRPGGADSLNNDDWEKLQGMPSIRRFVVERIPQRSIIKLISTLAKIKAEQTVFRDDDGADGVGL